MRFPEVRRVVLTGSGDSLYAGMAVEHLFAHHLRVPVVVAP